MKLTLVKQGEFLGTKCDFYVDGNRNIYMSRTQIGYALKYKDPANAVLRIHQRHYERLDKFCVNTKECQFVTPYPNKDKDAHTFMYVEKGIREICRWSKQIVADDFFDWVDAIIQSIKDNGFYIATEKDTRWLGIREDSKVVRRMETDQIKLFIEYAKAQGSQNADRYYVLLTKLINSKVGVDTGKRDQADQRTLLRLKSMETVVEMHLATLMADELPYKAIYQGVKNFIEAL